MLQLRRRLARGLGLAMAAVLSLACGAQSLMPSIPTFPPIPPTPSQNNVSTGSSPMSGDWNATTPFGRFAFTVDPDGTNVTTVVVKLTGFTCGGTTLTTEAQVLNQWPLDKGAFSGYVNLKTGHILDLYVVGVYDKAHKTFSGTWEEDAYGTHCTGKWSAAPRK
jgi:hypothetical protein